MLVPFPAGRQYSVILADPPWPYEVYSKATGHGRSAEAHYPTMTWEDLFTLPVSSIAAPDCALFMWAVNPSLDRAFELLKAWGFAYKTVAFHWAKQTRSGRRWHTGMGHYTRANVEPVLLGMRGRMERHSKGVRSLIDGLNGDLIEAPLGAHSEKPPEIRDRIVALLGDVPRIELFARAPAPGWDGWGLEYGTRGTQLGMVQDAAIS